MKVNIFFLAHHQLQMKSDDDKASRNALDEFKLKCFDMIGSYLSRTKLEYLNLISKLSAVHNELFQNVLCWEDRVLHPQILFTFFFQSISASKILVS